MVLCIGTKSLKHQLKCSTQNMTELPTHHVNIFHVYMLYTSVCVCVYPGDKKRHPVLSTTVQRAAVLCYKYCT